MENQGYPAYEEQLDLKRYFQIIIRHKWLGLIIMVMVAVLVALYSLSLPESYDASFDIYYSNKNQQSVSNDNDVSYQSLDVDYWVKAMHSSRVYELVRDHSGLAVSMKQLEHYFAVSSNKNENLFEVRLQVPDPEYVPLLSSAFLRAIQDMDRHNQSSHFQSKVNYLQSEIQRNSRSIDSMDTRIMQLSHELNLQNIESVEQLTSLREGFKQDLKNTEVQLSYIQASRQKTENELKSLNDTLFEKSSFTEPLKVQLMNLHVDLARALTKYGEQHPVVKGIRENIVHVEEMLTQGYEENIVIKDVTANPIKRDLLGQLINLKIDEMSLQAKITSLENILESANTISSPNQQLYQLLRNRETTLATIDFLNKKVIDLNMTREGVASSFYLIDMPATPMESSNRKGKLLLILGLMAGFVAGIGAIIIYDMLDDRIKLVDDFKRFFNMPVLGAIRHRSGKDLLVEAKKEAVDEVYAEYENELTDLRVNIKQLIKKQNKVFFSVISPVRKDGKTLLLYLLALEYAKTRKKVLIVDFDIYSPKISRHFDLEENEGVQNFLLEDKSFDSLVHKTDIENIDLISAGSNPYKVKLLFDTDRVDEFFKEMHDKYDYVFVDTPALLLSPEVTGLLSRMDVNLLVTRIGHTSRKNIDLVLDKLRNLKRGILGTILTDIKPIPMGSYYDRYNNYSRYRKYYSYDERPASSSEKKKLKRRKNIALGASIFILAALISTGIIYREQLKDINIPLIKTLYSQSLTTNNQQLTTNNQQLTDSNDVGGALTTNNQQLKTTFQDSLETKAPSSSFTPPETPRYHVIAGSFSQLSNAEKVVAEMQKLGYDAKLMDEKINKLYCVVIDAITDREQAIQYVENHKPLTQKSLWLYKK